MPVDNIEDINNILNNIKNEYKDATHYCYAYIINNTKRFNDDGEPGGRQGQAPAPRTAHGPAERNQPGNQSGPAG